MEGNRIKTLLIKYKPSKKEDWEGQGEESDWICNRLLSVIREKVDYYYNDGDDTTFPFQRNCSVCNCCNPKNIQDSIHAMCFTGVVVPPKFVRTPLLQADI
jgi:hypothetical protein